MPFDEQSNYSELGEIRSFHCAFNVEILNLKIQDLVYWKTN